MDELKQHINNQLQSNRGKNLLIEGIESNFKFINETEAILKSIEKINNIDKNSLIAYTTDKAIEEFCKLNQYYSFDINAKNELNEIYINLFDSLKKNEVNLKTIQNPILDIGCGSSKNLVHYLISQGFKAFGIDRFVDNSTISKKQIG